MSLPFGLLGLLKYRESTGYDLARMFEESLNSFWHAQSSQIYRELTRMEEKGWVVSRNVIQSDRPNKKIYSITQDGINALYKWINESADLFENPHDPLLMRIFFGANSQAATLERLKSYRDMCIDGLTKQTEKFQANIEHYKQMLPDGNDDSIFWQMTVDSGVAHAKASIQWANACIEKLENELKT